MTVVLTTITLLLSTACYPVRSDSESNHRRPQPKGLYSYVAPYSENGQPRIGIFPTSTEQMTTLFPESDLIDGVVLLLHWSILNPQPNIMRWDIIEHVLNYWHKKNKTVSFVISPVGSYVQMSKEFGGELTGATPNWVLKRINTFRSKTSVVIDGRKETRELEFPEYMNNAFLNYYFDFLREFSTKYDRDERIAFVRIFSGYNGEEVASVNGGNGGFPRNFTYDNWLRFQNSLVDTHTKIFQSTPLEIDLALTGRMYNNRSRKQFGGKPSNQQILDFVDKLCQQNIAIGNNGLNSDTIDMLTNKGERTTQIFDILKYAKNKQNTITIETKSPPTSNDMLDTDKILAAIKQLQPDRINVFGAHIAASTENVAKGKAQRNLTIPFDNKPTQMRDHLPDIASRNLMLLQDMRTVVSSPQNK